MKYIICIQDSPVKKEPQSKRKMERVSMSSLKDKAYEIIKKRIMDATYPAQTFIDEKALAQELNTSRTPVREALIALSQEGFLQILPKRGIMVLSFTYQDALDIFQVRMLLEPWLIRTYGPQLTKEELEHERELVIKEIVEETPPKRSRPGISMRHHPHLLLMEKCTNRNINSMLEYSEQQIERIPDAQAPGCLPRGAELRGISKEGPGGSLKTGGSDAGRGFRGGGQGHGVACAACPG